MPGGPAGALLRSEMPGDGLPFHVKTQMVRFEVAPLGGVILRDEDGVRRHGLIEGPDKRADDTQRITERDVGQVNGNALGGVIRIKQHIQAGRLFVRTLSAQGQLSLTDSRLLTAAKGADIFLDTAIRFMTGDENNAAEQKIFASVQLPNPSSWNCNSLQSPSRCKAMGTIL